MNWISLNGIKSNTINGLLIQELPPISKPLMRTEIEQIDGRDGDIVTNLGYSAYDKSMTIGLYGNYDIDDVIAYFASSGTVTFSNEPDKYYNYQVIQQIDFERLVRFRTATVTFHVQPFKYSVVGDDITASAEQWDGLHDTSITKNGVTGAASGGNITISGTAASAATVLAMAADTLEMTPGSLFMIHDPIVGAIGNEADLMEAIGLLRACKDSIINVYATCTLAGRDQISQMMKETTWMDAEAALAYGFIDRIASPSAFGTVINCAVARHECAFSVPAPGDPDPGRHRVYRHGA